MPDKTARGRFVWHELTVPDAARAHQFYGKVVGWKTQPFEQDPSYQMFATSAGPLGGSVADPESPPHWLPYIGTTEIETAVRDAVALGAKLIKDITPIANGDRWARLEDPQGAAFAVHQCPIAPGREKPPKRGEFSWHELMTTDYKAAFKFYSTLFGWETAGEADMGPELGTYFMFGRNGVPLGGMFNQMPNMPGGPAWTGYVRVKDVNVAVKKAQAGGATLINGPMEVPGGDWIAQFVDPQGAMFAVHVLKDDVAPPAAESPTPVPLQGTLDFPPVATSALERVSVVAKQPAAKAKAKSKAKPVAKATKKAAAAKSPKKAKVAGRKKAAAKKGAKKPVRKAVKKAKKPARRAPAKKSRKAVRRPK